MLLICVQEKPGPVKWKGRKMQPPQQMMSMEEEELLIAHLLGFLLPREVLLPGQRSLQGNSAPALLSRQRGSKVDRDIRMASGRPHWPILFFSPSLIAKRFNLVCNCFLFSFISALLMGPGAGFRNSTCPSARIGVVFFSGR